MAAFFPDDIFKWIFLNENIRISLRISLKFVPRVRINNIPALVQIMAWHRPGDKPLYEPMMVSLLTHICVTRTQWLKYYYGRGWLLVEEQRGISGQHVGNVILPVSGFGSARVNRSAEFPRITLHKHRISLSHPGLGWFYVFSPFPPRPPPQKLFPLTSKPFELNLWYLAQRIYGPIDNERKDMSHPFMTMILTCVTMVGWADVPYSDRGDFRRQRAVDIYLVCIEFQQCKYGRRCN